MRGTVIARRTKPNSRSAAVNMANPTWLIVNSAGVADAIDDKLSLCGSCQQQTTFSRIVGARVRYAYAGGPEQAFCSKFEQTSAPKNAGKSGKKFVRNHAS